MPDASSRHRFSAGQVAAGEAHPRPRDPSGSGRLLAGTLPRQDLQPHSARDAGIAGDAEFRRLFARAARRGYKPGDDAITFVVFDELVLFGKSVMDQPGAREGRLSKSSSSTCRM
jgi:hypothetical protein